MKPKSLAQLKLASGVKSVIVTFEQEGDGDKEGQEGAPETPFILSNLN